MAKSNIRSAYFEKLVTILSMFFLLMSCSTITQMYSGPERPANEIALIRPADTGIEIVRCDGTRLSGTSAAVLPGDHTAEVTYSDHSEGYYMVGTQILRWKAEAGHTYVVDKILHTAPGMTAMYIIDRATGKKFSGGISKPGEEAARLQMIEKKIKEFPQYSDFWAEKGYLLITLKRFDEAIPAIETALSLKPENASAWSVKSLYFYGQRQYEESLAAIDKTIQFRGNESDKKFREEILKKIEEKKKTGTQTAP